MPRDFQREALREVAHKESVRAWIQLRIRNIHDRISAHDVLRRFGVDLRYEGSEHTEQFSCPFHGVDRKPSAKVYPADANGPSGAWCFVCQERWDAISLWRKYTDETRPFTQVLADIERECGIAVPEAPRGPVSASTEPEVPEVVERLMKACEGRLRAEKAAFEPRAHLTLGVLLDQVHFQMRTGRIPHKEAEGRLRRILDKIGEKVRCRVG